MTTQQFLVQCEGYYGGWDDYRKPLLKQYVQAYLDSRYGDTGRDVLWEYLMRTLPSSFTVDVAALEKARLAANREEPPATPLLLPVRTDIPAGERVDAERVRALLTKLARKKMLQPEVSDEQKEIAGMLAANPAATARLVATVLGDGNADDTNADEDRGEGA